MWAPELTLGFLLAGRAIAGVVRDGTIVLKRTVGDLERRDVVQNFTSQSWDQDTEAACTAALESMNGAPDSPTGLAACYNIAELDTSTGRFQADVRLYSMAPPSGEFANMAGTRVTASMLYDGAIVTNQTTSLGKRDGTSSISWPRDAMWSRASLSEAGKYTVKGVIDSGLLGSMNSTTEQQTLVPTVMLSGVSSNGTAFKSALSSQNASYVNGVFSPVSRQAATGIKKAVVSSPIQTLVVSSDAAFVVPGVNIMIFPIGGVITGIWGILFFATIAYGTWGRMQWRDTHRRRVAAMTKASMARI